MLDKLRRRDLTVKTRHKDGGLREYARQENRRQRHVPLAACPDCGAPGMADAYYDGGPGDDPRRCSRCGTL